MLPDRGPLKMTLRKAWPPAVSAIVLIAASFACTRPAKPPNVLLIVVDTLRADHLGCYGYSRNTSPNIDGLSERSTLYTRAMSSAPWTVPSHGSMFTGLNPFEHGAHTCKPETPQECVFPLPERHTTLAEVLRDRGYRTAGYVANAAYLNEFYQLDQGFESWNVAYARADQVTSAGLSWVEKHREEPFFLFLNYMDTHQVYNTSERPGLLEEPAAHGGALLDELIAAVLPGNEVPADLARQVIDQYDTGIANADHALGELFEGLRHLDLFDETVVVITSDHGEYFGEHLLVEHSKDVYQPAQWVPLIVHTPGQDRGQRIDTTASSTDVPHLIVSEFPDPMRAELVALFPNAPGNHIVISENYYSRSNDLYDERWGHRFDRVRTAIYDWPHKYIRSSDGHHELYSLDTDPDEAANLYAEGDPLSLKLSAELASFQAASLENIELSAEPPPEMTEELREQLRSLGYLN